jgi:hypothetical protein
MRALIFVLASLAFAVTTAPAGAVEDGKQVYYFAAGWRVDQGVPQNVLQLGTLYPCPSGWCVEIEEFAGGKNIDRVLLNERHHMRAPYRKGGCTDGRLTTIHGDKSIDARVSVLEANGTLTVETPHYKYVWKRENSKNGGYALVASKHTSSELAFSQPVGYAYLSGDATNVVFEWSQVSAAYGGDIAHKNMNIGVLDDWQVSSSGFTLNRFSRAEGSGVFWLTVKGLDSVNKAYGKEMFVNHSVLPPTSTGHRLRYFQHEYGHDFNANGCFDDLGHNKMMLPVLRNGLVSAFVYVEYTHDKKDGVPMLSVGRYERR